MAFDFKKELREFYSPGKVPRLLTLPCALYAAVRGEGNPNLEGSEYQLAVEALYSIAYTIKMSKMGNHHIKGYFDFTVPPLEGLWWEENEGKAASGFSGDKCAFRWISLIRLPDFVTPEEFQWARQEAQRKKGKDFSKAELLSLDEGACAQILHTGSYDSEPETIRHLMDFIREKGLRANVGHGQHFHHEIYLNDPRRTDPEKLRTIIRYPVTPI